MTDRSIVSRKELEMATAMVSQDIANILREIIDTAEEAESAWITDRAPTVEEAPSSVDCRVTIVSRVTGERMATIWNGDDTRTWWGLAATDYPNTWCVVAWQPLNHPAPYTPPVKRLCWCGAEMEMFHFSDSCFAHCEKQGHGTGPEAPTESEAWAAYDKMVGR